MTLFRSIPPIVFVILGGIVVFGVPGLYGIVLQPRYQFLQGNLALEVVMRVLPWTFPLIFLWGLSQGQQNVQEILQARGVVAPASITWVRDSDTVENGAPVLELFVRVTPAHGDPFDTTVKALAKADKEPYRPGMVVQVRYDPENPTSVIRLEE